MSRNPQPLGADLCHHHGAFRQFHRPGHADDRPDEGTLGNEQSGPRNLPMGAQEKPGTRLQQLDHPDFGYEKLWNNNAFGQVCRSVQCHNALPAASPDMPGLEYGGTVTIGRNYGSRIGFSHKQFVIVSPGTNHGFSISHNPKAIAPHRAISRRPTRPRLSRYSDIQFLSKTPDGTVKTAAPRALSTGRSASSADAGSSPSAPPIPPIIAPHGRRAADAAGALMILQVSPAAPFMPGGGHEL